MNTAVYERAMRDGAEEYGDILRLLSENGYRPEFTQTGGMCPAIELNLSNRHNVLITDVDQPLPWTRSEQSGWAVGVYDSEDVSEAILYATTQDGTPAALLELLASLPPQEA